ncbi:hypothetical protein ADUPG1_000297 [Aduncisulcus paluster]|uniref:Uncharacterized protein n=1 Tax=Aduncisulcus paluster TaxID=2918883 RepID=A0ABQ5K7Q7_9EUKA|nr:hypothetical protein ADUPG1_000297 [Aduncisulcus paluster]
MYDIANEHALRDDIDSTPVCHESAMDPCSKHEENGARIVKREDIREEENREENREEREESMTSGSMTSESQGETKVMGKESQSGIEQLGKQQKGSLFIVDSDTGTSTIAISKQSLAKMNSDPSLNDLEQERSQDNSTSSRSQDNSTSSKHYPNDKYKSQKGEELHGCVLKGMATGDGRQYRSGDGQSLEIDEGCDGEKKILLFSYGRPVHLDITES